MTSPAITVEATDTLQLAAEQMASRRINRLPVVEGARLVGIVTRADVVRAYVRSDAELERLVREEVLAKTAFTPRAGGVRGRRPGRASSGSRDGSTGAPWPRRSSR